MGASERSVRAAYPEGIEPPLTLRSGSEPIALVSAAATLVSAGGASFAVQPVITATVRNARLDVFIGSPCWLPGIYFRSPAALDGTLSHSVHSARRDGFHNLAETRSPGHHELSAPRPHRPQHPVHTFFDGHHRVLHDGPSAEKPAVRSQGALRDVRCHESGIDHRNANAFPFKFDSKRVEETRHGMLRRRVESPHWHTGFPGKARHRDDVSPRPLQMRQRVPCAVHSAEIVDAHDPVGGFDVSDLIEPR